MANNLQAAYTLFRQKKPRCNFDEDIRFSSQISRLVRKACSSPFFILRDIKRSDKEILLQLYESHVLPHPERCS